MLRSAIARAAAAAVALVCLAPPAAAESMYLFGDRIQFAKNSDRFEAKFGVMSYDTGVFGPNQFDGVVFNGELLFPSPGFLAPIGAPRPHIGFDAAVADDPVHFFYAGLTWDAYLTNRFYLSGSLGGAVHTAKDLIAPTTYKPLGCRVLFQLGASVGFDITDNATVQLYADHFSNANLCDRNGGAEAAGIRFGYRF